MCLLQNVTQSWLEAALLVNPVNDFTIGSIATDSVAQELANTYVVIHFNSDE
ncbi:hypothetical protein D3C80_2146300 [compost metagenome]